MMTLTQLEYVVAVERHGNFRLAAKACHVTQPTLSMAIQKLEEHLEVVLFDRSAHPIRPTPIGAKILGQARVVLAEAARVAELVDQERDAVRGELRLAVIPTLAPYLLPLFLDRFAKEHPEVSLHVEEAKTDDIVVALQRNQLDVGLAATPLGEPELTEHVLFNEPFYVYASKTSPLARRDEVSDKDLEQQDLLLLAEGHCMREQMLRVCKLRRGKTMPGAGRLSFESGSIETLCHLVEKGHGYTVVPHLARTWQETRAGKVIPFSAPSPSREVSLVVHKSFVRRSLLAALTKVIVASLPPELRRPGKEHKIIALR